MSIKLPFNQPFVVGKELYYIAQAVISGKISGDGIFTKRCHEWLKINAQAKQALLTHSCTAALEMSALLCDISAGDEVIMPSYTFVSTANAFVLRGARPVFVDVRGDTLNIDENLIEQAITEKTKAIVPVHYAGVPCEMDAIMNIARRQSLWVIEDAAQGLMVDYGGRPLGSIGHFGCLSFHETKNVISGEGGALLVNDDRFTERAEIIREKGTNRSQFFRGQVDKYTWVDVGSSYLPSDIIGAFLFAQLENAESITQHRRQICNWYFERLQALFNRGDLGLPICPSPNGHMFYVQLESLDVRTRLIEHLRAQSILAVFHYVPLHSAPAGLKYGRQGSSMTVTDNVADRLLRLPVYYEMSEADVERICNEIGLFFRGLSQ